MESVKRSLLGVLSLSLCAAVLGEFFQKSVREGENVEFQCNYPSSNTNAGVRWKYNNKDDVALVYYEGALTTPYKDRAQYFPQGLMLKSVTRKDTGLYTCEVTYTTGDNTVLKESQTQLVVLVPPSVPVAQVPSSAIIGGSVTLYCVENDASPRPKITWYKNKIKMPADTKTNSTYTIDPTTGDLTFKSVTQEDSGEYNCEAYNELDTKRSAVVLMETYEKNVGGIVAAVIVVLLILVLIAVGLWFAYSRGYIGKKTNKKVIYSQPSETRSDKNFQQTSSFVV